MVKQLILSKGLIRVVLTVSLTNQKKLIEISNTSFEFYISNFHCLLNCSIFVKRFFTAFT